MGSGGNFIVQTKLVVAAAAALTLFDIASAAAEPVVAPDWTGFYVGGELGYRWDKVKGDGFDVTGVSPDASRTFKPSNVAIGGKVGYDVQVSPSIVIGAFATFDWAKKSKSASSPLTTLDGVVFGAGQVTIKHTWSSTIAARAGVLVGDNVLLYGLGGLALLREKVTTSVDTILGSASDSKSKTRAGWTLGGGVEVALTEHWRANIEYRYADFGSKTYSSSELDVRGKSKLHTNTILSGVSYKF